MAGIDQIVSVTIINATPRVSAQGFGIPLIVGYHNEFQDLVREYTSLSALAEDFPTDDPIYKAASACFSQNPSPERVIVGKRDLAGAEQQVVNITLNGAIKAVGYTYSFVFNGLDIEYTVQSLDTAADVIAGLNTAIGATALTVTTDITTPTTLKLTWNTAGEQMEIVLGDDNVLNYADATATDDLDDDLTAIFAVNQDWYAIISTTRSPAEQAEAAAWAQANDRIFLMASQNSDVKASGSGDVFSTLRTAGYTRTLPIWHHAAHQYPEAAWGGIQLPKNPGSSNWAYKDLAGVSTSNAYLTDSEKANIEGKNGNYFVETKGARITHNGKTSGGEWIDIVRGLDWLKARMQERIFAVMSTVEKIPFTDAGIKVVEAEIRAQLDEAVRRSVLVEGYTVSVPRASAVSSVDKAARLLPDLSFSATLAGAINNITIDGRVSV